MSGCIHLLVALVVGLQGQEPSRLERLRVVIEAAIEDASFAEARNAGKPVAQDVETFRARFQALPAGGPFPESGRFLQCLPGRLLDVTGAQAVSCPEKEGGSLYRFRGGRKSIELLRLEEVEGSPVSRVRINRGTPSRGICPGKSESPWPGKTGPGSSPRSRASVSAEGRPDHWTTGPLDH